MKAQNRRQNRKNSKCAIKEEVKEPLFERNRTD